MRQLTLPLLAVAACVSCATSNARGAKVVQTSTVPAGCVVLGPIRGSDESIDVGKAWEHLQLAPSKKAAISDALDQAGAKGATHASLDEPRPQEKGFYVDGMAYDCSSSATIAAPPPPAAAPAPPTSPASPAAAPEAPPPAWLGCAKDTDCKGARICRNRECVDP